ncbi:MAG: nucleotidyltransferase domain-containing protein [Chloroflexota bacterium]|nr:nucleotidyltransferase domain-containing protein [Chloroflexota bacterium]
MVATHLPGPVTDQAIQELVRRIVAGFQPQQVLLFGSYAYGTPTSESDVDLLVVMDTPLREVQQAVAIYQAVPRPFGLDLIVHTPARLGQRLDLGDAFLREIVSRGKVLYERPDSRVG